MLVRMLVREDCATYRRLSATETPIRQAIHHIASPKGVMLIRLELRCLSLAGGVALAARSSRRGGNPCSTSDAHGASIGTSRLGRGGLDRAQEQANLFESRKFGRGR
jgi:hypothetical protein